MDENKIKLLMPRFLLDLAHRFRVNLNSIYADENYETDVVIDLPLPEIIELMEDWGCEINHPNQFKYPDQVASGRMYLNNGKQFHVRVSKHPKGYMLKAHTEWHGVTHPFLHMMYANLDYEKGYRMLKKLLEKAKIKISVDKGKGKYNHE
jgi:hypothetical protein